MSLVTLAFMRKHLETDLVDDALQRLIDDAESEIDERHGSLLTQTDEYHGDTMSNAVFLKRKATMITTVIEEIKSGGGYEATTLAADDYELRYGGRQLRRLIDGTNPRSCWGDTVTVTYTPQDDTNRRIRVTIDMVKLAVVFNGLDSEKIGDYAAQSTKYEARRQELINRLTSWGFA